MLNLNTNVHIQLSKSMKYSFLNYTDKDVCFAISCIEAMGHLVYCLLII
jgi:hypothetical protein